MIYGSFMLLYIKNGTYGDVIMQYNCYNIKMICYMVTLPYNINSCYITMICYIVNLPYNRTMPYGNTGDAFSRISVIWDTKIYLW